MKKPRVPKYDPLGNARILATAFQTAEEGNRTLLLLQAREALILAQGGDRKTETLERLGNAVDYALILAERVGNNAEQIEQIKRGQDAVMHLIHGGIAYLPDIRNALDILDVLFCSCTSIEIGKARQEWRRRIDAGLTLEAE
ncbi:hypothetical protein [Petrachloros mirabilis]